MPEMIEIVRLHDHPHNPRLDRANDATEGAGTEPPLSAPLPWRRGRPRAWLVSVAYEPILSGIDTARHRPPPLPAVQDEQHADSG